MSPLSFHLTLKLSNTGVSCHHGAAASHGQYDSTTYRPELDVSRELNVADAAYYQSLIGILSWILELGQVDVCLEVSMMSSHLALPREGHLEQVLHIFAYLKKYHNTELVSDPSDHVVDENDFERRDSASSNLAMWKGKKSFLQICQNLEVMDSS